MGTNGTGNLLISSKGKLSSNMIKLNLVFQNWTVLSLGKVKLKEMDLYEPINKYFKRKGFEVYGEVKDCDMAVIKDDLLILVELKLNLSVDLLIQATKRQRVSEHVYVAIPKPKNTILVPKNGGTRVT